MELARGVSKARGNEARDKVGGILIMLSLRNLCSAYAGLYCQVGRVGGRRVEREGSTRTVPAECHLHPLVFFRGGTSTSRDPPTPSLYERHCICHRHRLCSSCS